MICRFLIPILFYPWAEPHTSHGEGRGEAVKDNYTECKKKLETNSQYVFKLLRSSDILCLQETWLFNFQLSRPDEIHKDFEGFGKAVDDNDPIPPTQKPCGYGGVAKNL